MACTLKDIAAKAGVSIVTVHKCIYNKPGISDATRQKVLAVIDEMDYTVNPTAAALKRDPLNIAVVTPETVTDSSFFYHGIDRGIQRAAQDLKKFNISVIRFPSHVTWQSEALVLDELLIREDIHGVVLLCLHDIQLNDHLLRFKQKNIPVITYHLDARCPYPVWAVPSPNLRIGKLAAEFMSAVVPSRRRIAILGGNRQIQDLQETVLGFTEYMQEFRPDLSLHALNEFEFKDEMEDELTRVLPTFTDLGGIYCNNARSCLTLCHVLKRLNLAGKLKVLTTDVFADQRQYFDNGTITATLWQNPEAQSNKAIYGMFQYLTTKTVEGLEKDIPIGIVMKNNFEDYLR